MINKQNIDVSYILSVYNKEYYLPAVIKALKNQTGVKNPEFIFCDDVSSDKSIEVIREETKDLDNVIIIENDENKGPSVRINQGLEVASGEWIRPLDSDDIFPLDSTEKMLELAEKHNADIVYGKFTRTGEEPDNITERFLPKGIEYKYSKDTLKAVLTGRFTRMGQLIKASVFKKAGGADPKIFIQDESIPLRIAKYGKGIIKMDVNVVLVPKEIGNLSGNKVQLDHDRYLAHYYAIMDNKDEYSKEILHLLNKRAVSAYWKYIRKINKNPYFTKTFLIYLTTKLFKLQPNIKYLTNIRDEFLSIDGVLRVK